MTDVIRSPVLINKPLKRGKYTRALAPNAGTHDTCSVSPFSNKHIAFRKTSNTDGEIVIKNVVVATFNGLGSALVASTWATAASSESDCAAIVVMSYGGTGITVNRAKAYIAEFVLDGAGEKTIDGDGDYILSCRTVDLPIDFRIEGSVFASFDAKEHLHVAVHKYDFVFAVSETLTPYITRVTADGAETVATDRTLTRMVGATLGAHVPTFMAVTKGGVYLGYYQEHSITFTSSEFFVDTYSKKAPPLLIAHVRSTLAQAGSMSTLGGFVNQWWIGATLKKGMLWGCRGCMSLGDGAWYAIPDNVWSPHNYVEISADGKKAKFYRMYLTAANVIDPLAGSIRTKAYFQTWPSSWQYNSSGATAWGIRFDGGAVTHYEFQTDGAGVKSIVDVTPADTALTQIPLTEWEWAGPSTFNYGSAIILPPPGK